MSLLQQVCCMSLLLLAVCASAVELPAGWRALQGTCTPGDAAVTLGDRAALGHSETLAPGLYELTVIASGTGRLTLSASGEGFRPASRTLLLYGTPGVYGLLFEVAGTLAAVPSELRVAVSGGTAVVRQLALQPATAEQQARWKDAQDSFIKLGYYGTDPQRLAPAAPQGTNTATGKPYVMRERVVFYDANYDCCWVDRPDKVAQYFTRRGFVQMDTDALARWLRERVTGDTALGTSVTFTMGVVPMKIVYKPYADCLLAQYLQAGGRVVYLTNIPMYVAQDDVNQITMYGDEPREQMLGIGMSDRKFYYGSNDAPVYTAAAKAWGLEPGLSLTRPALNRGVTQSFVTNADGTLCGAGLVNFRPDAPLSGFIFVPNWLKATDEPLLRNAYRFATYTGQPVTVPELPSLPDTPTTLTADLRFGADGMRACYLRSETAPINLRLWNPDAAELPIAIDVTVKDGRKTLLDKHVEVRLASGASTVEIAKLDLAKLRMGIYPVTARIASATVRTEQQKDLYVCPPVDHEGTHVGVWLTISDKPRRAEHALQWLQERNLQPMMVDDNTYYPRDHALWYGFSFTVRRHGDAAVFNDPQGYDSFRYTGDGQIMRVPAWGNKRVSRGYASPVRRQAEAELFGKIIAEDTIFPAFRMRAVTGDDYSQWFGLDYNRYVLEGFKAKYGIDAPRPKGTEDTYGTPDVEHPNGIIPDNDSWLLLNRYWSEDVLGDYGFRVAEQMRKATGGKGKVGIIPGGLMLPVMQMWSAQYPPLNFGPRGFNLTTFYYYNNYWQPQMAHIWWLECARMGNRDQEQLMMPNSYIAGESPSYYRNTGWMVFAGGATTQDYFIFEQRSHAGEEAMSFFGGISQRYGRLLGAITPARKKVGMLVPFEQLTYHITSCYEMAYPFMDMLLAKVDVEPVTPMELTPQHIRRYDAIVVAQVQWLTQSTAQLLAEYAKAGGKLIIDGASAKELQIPGAIRLAKPLSPEPWIGGYGKTDTIAAVRAALEPYVKPVVDCDDPFTTVRRFTGDGRQYIWLVHNATNEEYMALRNNPSDPKIAEGFGYGKTIITSTLTLADDGSVPYDVFAGKPLPVNRADGKMRVTVTLRKYEGTLIALLPAAPTALSAGKPATANGVTRIILTVQGKQGPVDALFPLHVTVTDPRGAVNREYAQRLLAHHGVAEYAITFAANDLRGKWSFAAVDAMTGLTARWTVRR